MASRRTVPPIDPRAGHREGKLKRVLDYAARTVVGLWGLNDVARRMAIAWWGFCRPGGHRKVVRKQFSALVGRGRWHRRAGNSWVPAGTFETNGNGCPIAFEQAVQRGMETARLLCCHDVSMMSGTDAGDRLKSAEQHHMAEVANRALAE